MREFGVAIAIAAIGLSVAGRAAVPAATSVQHTETITLRGRPQTLRVYGPATGDPVVVTSGDGGWIHLGPHVAELLAARGWRVIGFDARAYLESFTSSRDTLDPAAEPSDFVALAAYGARGAAVKPLLIGVSEGAGLSVLAATDPAVKRAVAGVIGLGLPDVNELGWRWKDALIYVTHGVPNEPSFSASSVIAKVAPLPLAAIHSTHDDFVPLATIHKVFDAAGDPKRLWVIEAADHGFSDKLAEFDQTLLDAITWVRAHPIRPE